MGVIVHDLGVSWRSRMKVEDEFIQTGTSVTLRHEKVHAHTAVAADDGAMM